MDTFAHYLSSLPDSSSSLTIDRMRPKGQKRGSSGLLRTTAIIVLISFVSVIAPASPFEEELEKLIKQRDAAIEREVAPINEKFKDAAQEILRRAVQAGDLDAAQKIKAMIESAKAPAPLTERVQDARTQLAGTKWVAEDPTSLRPGFAASLVFTEETVEPGGYRYEATSRRTVSVVFHKGDRQPVELTRGGTQLEVKFKSNTFVYKIDAD